MILKTFNLFFKIILFCLPITYILYIRLIFKRLPRLLENNMSVIAIIITLIILIVACIRFYIVYKKTFIAPKEAKNKIIIYIKKICINIIKIIHNLWYDFYSTFIQKFLILNLFLLSIIKKLENLCTFVKGIMILLFMYIIPKIIVIALFLIDVFYFHQLNYFYKSLCLLLLPLFYDVFMSIILQFHEDNAETLTSYLVINNSKNTTYFKYAANFTPPDYIKDINDFVNNYYLPILRILDITAFFEQIKMLLKIPLMNVIIAGLYIIGWLGVLYYGIPLNYFEYLFSIIITK